jgi:aldehyde:ferredoxin oxidoreductase
MSLGGFAGRILFVDLTSGRIDIQPLDSGLAEQFIGGLGLCIKLFYDHQPPGSHPLSPESCFVLGAGPLVGTYLPSTSRVYAVSKLPASGTVGWCGSGGFSFGAGLKYAGFDHIVIHGKSNRPVMLHIEDGKAELRDARHLWGLGVEQTSQTIWRENSEKTGVVCIGPAGENQVYYAMAFLDRIGTMGRGGFGAVMGAKNLKAVTVNGTGRIDVADRKQFNRLSRTLFESIRDYPYLKEWQELGMVKTFPLIDKNLYKSIFYRRAACVSCPVGCKDVIRIPDGPFAGHLVHSSSVVNLFTPMIYGVKDHREAIRLVSELDSLGMDMFEFHEIMRLAQTLQQNGFPIVEPGEPEIIPDNFSNLMTWAEKISRREGTGDLLAGGFRAMEKRFGKTAGDLFPALVKHMAPYAGPKAAIPWDRFGTMELGQLLDPRGPHVGSGGSPTYFALRPLDVFPKHLRRMGVPDQAAARIVSRENETLDVGALLKYSHAWFVTLGSLGVCARAQVNRFYHADFLARAYEAATGIPTDLESLRQRVTRVFTLYRLANLREGLEPGAEAIPAKWFGEAGFKDYLSGRPLTMADAQAMVGNYFHEWGWDPETGIPTPDMLADLGLT